MSVASAVVHPGTISPELPVPKSIKRPHYVGRPAPEAWTGGEIKDAETIEKMRIASQIAARAMAAAAETIAPGVTTDAVDRVAHEYMCDHGAYPSCLGYRGFRKSICTSVNEVICHGIPDDRPLDDGDIVNLDVTAFINGVHGDTNATYLVGEVDEESRLLVERTHEAMMRGIKAAQPGRQLNVIGRVIEKYATRFGYGVVRDYTGHGIGEAFHSGLIVPHYDAAPAYSTIIEPGMTFTIEPMLNLGTPNWTQWDDGWTVVTKDLLRSAQFEHTVLITESGNEILTLPDMAKKKIAFGVDVGGSGIKGAPVNLSKGSLIGDRLRIPTPTPATPEAVADVIGQVLAAHEEVRGDAPIGVTVPGVVTHGVVRSAANIDPSWIGVDAKALFEKRLGHPVHVVNDADAAGVAEMAYGAAEDVRGLVIMTTLGTGIGTALIHDGVLIPNSELGHLELDGGDAEARAASSAREREELTWEQWAERLQRYYRHVEDVLWPDLFVVGGGVSSQADQFLPLLDLRTPIVAAKLRNKAGIIGAARLAADD